MIKHILLLGIALFILFSAALAEENIILNLLEEDALDDLYDRERHLAADTNKDGCLNKDELRMAADDFRYYLDRAHFILADTNHDGGLSLDEIRSQRPGEKFEGMESGKEFLHQAHKEYEGPQGSDIIRDIWWLKRHPSVTAELFGNWAWLKACPDIALEIIHDAQWLNRYRVVLEKVLANRRFLVYHYGVLEQIFQNKRFFDDNPEIARRMLHFKEWMARYFTRQGE